MLLTNFLYLYMNLSLSQFLENSNEFLLKCKAYKLRLKLTLNIQHLIRECIHHISMMLDLPFESCITLKSMV